MKRISTTALFVLSCLTISAQNPICPIGTYIADPTARVWEDGKLYIYGSSDESTSYYCSYRHDVLYSDDAKSWQMEHNVFSTVGENDAVKESDALLFAPDIMYRNNRYYLYFCSPNKKYSEGVAVSKSPLGPFKDAKKLDTSTFNEIDPTIFIDDDGQAYYYWGQGNLKVAKMNKDMTSLDTSSIKTGILDKKNHFFHEGSYAFKKDGIYYILYAHDGRRDRRPTCLGYATSDSPLGPFKYGGVVIDNFGCDPDSWNNHGSIAEFQDQWYIFYHRSSHCSRMMRRACMEPITFNEDGSIDEVEMTSQGAGGPLSAFETIEAERACRLFGYTRIKGIASDNEAVCNVRSGDVIEYKYLDFGAGATTFNVTLRSYNGGDINIRLDDPNGRVIGTLSVDPLTYKYVTLSCEIEKVKGVHALYFESIGRERGTDLFDIDNFEFK